MSQSSLFDVLLRLRPSTVTTNDRFLTVDQDGGETDDGRPAGAASARHISVRPPVDDRRKRTIERFEFTHVFEENATQQDVFDGIGLVGLVAGVLGVPGGEAKGDDEAAVSGQSVKRPGITVGRDAMIATLGVTGSGKTHTLLGSKTQPGLTQLALGALFAATQGRRVTDQGGSPAAIAAFKSLCAADVADANVTSARVFIDSVGSDDRGRMSRAGGTDSTSFMSYSGYAGARPGTSRQATFSPVPPFRPEDLPEIDTEAEYGIVISMFEVYNDRIFDLLAGPAPVGSTAHLAKRRALLFKPTEMCPDRKLVTGLRKVVCGSLDDAVAVLEIGLAERKVAGTGSNATSSRSHGFICIEVKKREKSERGIGAWVGTGLTIADLAGSERARQAKTTGSTLAEAGKINESLMYLGRCMQMQSDPANKNVVPYRQCKLTELLFSNSFPASTTNHHTHNSSTFIQSHRNPQKAIMIVAADPRGDYNATCQILRYSALARDVTVPRILSANSKVPLIPTIDTESISPAVSSSSGLKSTGITPSSRLFPSPSNTLFPPSSPSGPTVSNDPAVLAVQLFEEMARREEAEETIQILSDRLDSLETELRDELAEEMDELLASERRRWMGAWDEEADAREEWMDRKVELVMTTSTDHQPEQPQSRISSRQSCKISHLEQENDQLRRRIRQLEDQIGIQKSPTTTVRIPPLRPVDPNTSRMNIPSSTLDLDLPPTPSKSAIDQMVEVNDVDRVPLTSKKQRMLQAKRWHVVADDED